MNSSGSFTVSLPPGATGTQFLTFGTQNFDVAVPTANPIYIGFFMSLSVDSLGQFNDMLTMFAEYQVRAVRVEFEALMGDSFNSSAGSPIPEVLTAVDPTVASVPAFISTVEAYSNNKRTVLTQARTHRVRLRPRPAVQLYGSALATTYAYNDNVNDLWMLSNNSVYPPYYGLVGFIRNFPGTPGSGGQIRISATVEIAVRRPR